MKKTILFIPMAAMLFAACTTTQSLENPNDFREEAAALTQEEEKALNQEEIDGYLIHEELKVQDIPNTVLYIEQPVYIPEEKASENDYTKLSGVEAVNDSLKRATQSPENYKNGTFFYQFNENFVYEIYAQPYHLTDIQLQAGEIVIGTPLLSEDESVWELTAGVAKEPSTGQDIQHLFVKPTYSRQDSTLIIITDRRVYHFRLKSFSDTHMAMVKFTYPLDKNVWAKKEDTDGRSIENQYLRVSNPELLSFDYTIKYSRFKKPEFLPTRIYDDGQYTYIQVNEIVLQKKLPVLFNEKNEIINYSVHQNVFVIPRLINKVTLRLGKEKVTITKNVTKAKEVQEGSSE